MKRMKSKLALILVFAMLFNSFAYASNVTHGDAGGSESSVVGEGTNFPTVYSILIPSEVVFAIDKFNTQGQGQVASPDYVFANRANFSVKVEVTFRAFSTGASLGLVDFIERGDDYSSNTAAELSVFAIGATVAELERTSLSALELDRTTYNYNDASTLVPAEPAADKKSATGTIEFLLERAEGETDPAGTFDADLMADDELGVAAFRLTGDINAGANWDVNKVTVGLTFRLIGLEAGKQYPAERTALAAQAGGGHNMYPSDYLPPAGGGGGDGFGAVDLSHTYVMGTTPREVTVPFRFPTGFEIVDIHGMWGNSGIIEWSVLGDLSAFGPDLEDHVSEVIYNYGGVGSIKLTGANGVYGGGHFPAFVWEARYAHSIGVELSNGSVSRIYTFTLIIADPSDGF